MFLIWGGGGEGGGSGAAIWEAYFGLGNLGSLFWALGINFELRKLILGLGSKFWALVSFGSQFRAWGANLVYRNCIGFGSQ